MMSLCLAWISLLLYICLSTWCPCAALMPEFQEETTALGACFNQPCIHGLCVPVPLGKYRCYCRNGYTGLNCQTNYDDCKSGPCQNNASCIDGEDSFSCVCTAGYTGEFCESELNECLSNPCVNNGVCEDLLNRYVCHCPLAYEGINCETYFNACETQSGGELCQNGGTCVLLPGNAYACSCPDGYYGDHCELIDCPCLRGGGICIGSPAMSCLCPFGWTGKDCETRVEFCEESVCSDRGICVFDGLPEQAGNNHSSSNMTCFCVPDYHGTFCENQYDECIPDTICGDNATCVDDVDGYTCRCMCGSNGIHCDRVESCVPDYSRPSSTLMFTMDKSYGPCGDLCNDESSIMKTTSTYSASSSYPWFLSVTSSHFELQPSEGSSVEFSEVYSSRYSVISLTPRPDDSTKVPLLFSSYVSSNKFSSLGRHTTSAKHSRSLRNIEEMHTPTYSSTLTATVPMVQGTVFTSLPDHPLSVSDKVPGDEGLSSLNVCHLKKCQNGGSAIMKLTKKGNSHRYDCECLCKPPYTGPSCEDEVLIVIPQFHGQSFMLHSISSVEPGENLDIHIVFKASSNKGLVFFIDAVDKSAFLLLYIEDGVLKLRFSCGHQVTVFMENHVDVHDKFVSATVTLTWLTIMTPVYHAACSVGLLINGSLPMRGEHFVDSPAITHFKQIYIGGMPAEFTSVNPWLHNMPFLKGCVIELQINGKLKDLLHEAIDGAFITECSSSACYVSPCLNGATCENFDNHWRCLCSAEFSGPLCQHKTCRTNPCKHGGTCLSDPHSGYFCLCPYGKEGQSCEEDITIGYPLFRGTVSGYSSYAEYRQNLYRYHMEIRIAFATDFLLQKALLLFHGGQGELANIFMAVSMESGTISYYFNLGSGIRILKSVQPMLLTDPVHRIVVGRHQRYGWLELDSQPKVMGIAPSQFESFSQSSALFIGGHSSFNLSNLPFALRHYEGFRGCVLDVQTRYSPSAEFTSPGGPVNGRNTGQCNMSGCSLIRCYNGGTCIGVESSFRCECTKGFVGPLCREVETSCSTGNHKCLQHSKCVPLADGYRCDCPFSYAGRFCEKIVTINLPAFNGVNSYLSLPNKNMKHDVEVVLAIKPLFLDGLLFYSSQHLSPFSHDFISLFISSGYVHYVYNLGFDNSLSTRLTSSNKIFLDKWNVIKFGRYKRAAYLKVNNDTEVTTVSPPGRESLDIGTRFYFGGVPDLSSLVRGAVDNGVAYFTGCISIARINGDAIKFTESGKVLSQNVEQCQERMCPPCSTDELCTTYNLDDDCICKSAISQQDCMTIFPRDESKCWNGGTVFANSALNFTCNCPIGWSGQFCEKGSGATFSGKFTGKSYFQYKDRYADVIYTNISFYYSTEQSTAFIFCSSEGFTEDGDYIIGGLQNNRFHIIWSLGWRSNSELYTTEISHRQGLYHFVQMNRSQQKLTLTLDNVTYSSWVSGNFVELNTDGSYNFGSFPDPVLIERKAGGFFSVPFIGCIKDIFISGQRVNIANITHGQNIDSCS